MTESQLEALLYTGRASDSHKRMPDFPQCHQELKRKGMTKILLWQEYQQDADENAYGYNQFCNLYNDWLKLQKCSMRQHHVAGEKLFLDFCGPTIPVINPDTGEVRQAQIFVATLGASNYTYVEACENQCQESWLMANVRAFEFFGGVPQVLVPDNLKAAVSRADRYEPVLNENCRKLSRHYNTVVMPARPRKPKDKPKVENAVLVVERWILMHLRHEVFHTLAALNLAISELLQELNERPFRRLPGCRKSLYEKLDKPALKALPPYRYEYVDIRRAKVGPDYHVLYGKHAYSVPHALIGCHINIEAGARLVRFYHREHWLPSIHGHSNRAASPHRQNICRSRSASNNGVRTGCCPGEKASAVPPVPWWPGICTTGHIRNRPTGPAWGCSISVANMVIPGWRMPASRHCYWNDHGSR